MNAKAKCVRAAGLAIVLSFLAAVTPADAMPITLEFSGSVFNVTDPSDVFGTEIGDTYSIFLTYDADLLTGTPSPMGDFTYYETSPGQSAITFSFVSTGGDAFTSDNSYPITIGVKNTPDYLVTMMPGDGDDRFTLEGQFNEMATLSLVLVEALGANPLSSNELPSGGFGSGPGTWSVAEIDIDRTDLFANISAGVSNIESVAVPEPSAVSLYLLGGLLLCSLKSVKGLSRRSGTSSSS